MKIPALLLGRYADVESRCRTMVAALGKGAPWKELFGEMVDSDQTPGWLVLDGPAPNLGHEDHVHCFVPTRAVSKAIDGNRLPESTYRSVAASSFETGWGVLGLLGQTGRGFPEPDQYLDFLCAVRRFWDDFVAEEARYTTGTQTARPFWSQATTVTFVLGQKHGIGTYSREQLVAAIQQDSPTALLAMIDETIERNVPKTGGA